MPGKQEPFSRQPHPSPAMIARTTYSLLVLLVTLAVFLSMTDAAPVGSDLKKRCAIYAPPPFGACKDEVTPLTE
ncbi:hypothetical protein BGZ80_011359 [Entomortierella chlamydospora]|uniref:Transmembrane protein n=1 Tax=Entomortierella chlamydospora TaxID=101097 RepID=A0A9P6MTR9_9FUNG|nr:hypothetical protein BGZ80_011359 [Entomortierella chlamydospora]